MMRQNWIPLGFCFLLSVGCGGSQAPLAPPEPTRVTVEHPTERSLESLSEYTGRLAPMETQEVRAQVSGLIQEVKFKDGSFVEKGAELYLIDPEVYDAALQNSKALVKKAETEILTSQKQLELAKGEYERAVQSRGSLSQDEFARRKNGFDTAENAILSARSNLDAAKAGEKKSQLDRDRCVVRSSVKGLADRTLITPGNYVQAGQTLLCVVQSIDPMHVYFDVDEENSLAYRKLIEDGKLKDPRKAGQSLRCWVGLRNEQRNEQGRWPHEGTIDYIAAELIRGTGTRELRGLIKNPKIAENAYKLSAGDSVRVQVSRAGSENLITVPEVAIGSQQQQKFVYVITEKGGKQVAEFRPVKLGTVRELLGLRVQVILEGLKKEDLVVVNGLMRVRPGSEVKMEMSNTGTQPVGK
jgi:RND family efflux transporter MFP subunit